MRNSHIDGFGLFTGFVDNKKLLHEEVSDIYFENRKQLRVFFFDLFKALCPNPVKDHLAVVNILHRH